MEPWGRELLDIWHARIDQIAADSIPLFHRMMKGRYQQEDLAQMIRGAAAMVAEELEQRPSDLRDGYFQSLGPGLAANGERLGGLASQDLAIVLRIIVSVIPAMKPEHQAPAAEFFIEFQARFMDDLVRYAGEAGAPP